MNIKGVYDNLPLPAGQIVGLGSVFILDWLCPAKLPGSRGLHRAAGSGLIAAGLAANAWALAERRRQSSGAFELERPQSLVTTGPYGLSRNPMYVGWWFIHLGAGVLHGSAWVLLTMPTAALAEHRFVLAEERELAASFGPEFIVYAQRVARYIPGWHSRQQAVPGHVQR